MWNNDKYKTIEVRPDFNYMKKMIKQYELFLECLENKQYPKFNNLDQSKPRKGELKDVMNQLIEIDAKKKEIEKVLQKLSNKKRLLIADHTIERTINNGIIGYEIRRK